MLILRQAAQENWAQEDTRRKEGVFECVSPAERRRKREDRYIIPRFSNVGSTGDLKEY